MRWLVVLSLMSANTDGHGVQLHGTGAGVSAERQRDYEALGLPVHLQTATELFNVLSPTRMQYANGDKNTSLTCAPMG
jgi:hypothetical protein